MDTGKLYHVLVTTVPPFPEDLKIGQQHGLVYPFIVNLINNWFNVHRGLKAAICLLLNSGSFENDGILLSYFVQTRAFYHAMLDIFVTEFAAGWGGADLNPVLLLYCQICKLQLSHLDIQYNRFFVRFLGPSKLSTALRICTYM
jgi:hypothetical protein